MIERAREEDAEAMAAVYMAGVAAGYQGLVPDAVLGDKSPRPFLWRKWIQRSRASTFVARVDGEVVGFGTVQAIGGDSGEGVVGEIPIVVVLPSHWRRGLGRELCEQLLVEAKERGVVKVVLWVLESNDRARQLYTSLGFHPDGGSRVFDESGATPLRELKYRKLLTSEGATGAAAPSSET